VVIFSPHSSTTDLIQRRTSCNHKILMSKKRSNNNHLRQKESDASIQRNLFFVIDYTVGDLDVRNKCEKPYTDSKRNILVYKSIYGTKKRGANKSNKCLIYWLSFIRSPHFYINKWFSLNITHGLCTHNLQKGFFYFYFYIWIAPFNGFQWSIAYKWETLIARHGFPPICIDMWQCSGIFAFAVTKDTWQFECL